MESHGVTTWGHTGSPHGVTTRGHLGSPHGVTCGSRERESRLLAVVERIGVERVERTADEQL
eukprot:21890-Prymnesium_polylepis.1